MRSDIMKWARDTGHPYEEFVASQATVQVETRVVDVRPEVERFEHVGGNEFEMTILWRVNSDMPQEGKYWSFTQFCNREYATDGDIVFRFTPWPEPPVTEWKKGDEVRVGPIKVTVPDHAGAGKYTVRCGLWDPETRKGPGIFLHGQGNREDIGTLTINKEGAQITAITYEPAR
jgi:hypothetical protein